MDMRQEVSFIKRGHNLIMYAPWAIDKFLTVTMAGVIILGIFLPLELAFQLGAIGAFIIISVYFVGARTVGKWDYHSGTWATQRTIEHNADPEWVKLRTKIDTIQETLNDNWFAIMAAFAMEYTTGEN